MDFGDILNDWEKATAKPYGKKKLQDDDRRAHEQDRESAGQDSGKNDATPATKKTPSRAHPVDVWLRQNGVQDKDTLLSESKETLSPAERRHRLRMKKPEATIDLHGLTRDDAWIRLETFIADCHRRGVQKVLIIHGKGIHSGSEAVLSQLVKTFIEQNSHTGESGFSDREAGGSGSTWVVLK